MNIPDYIQVTLDVIEEEDNFALEAEYQLVEWLEEIESGCSLNLLNISMSGSETISESVSLSSSLFGSMYGSGSWSRSWSSSESRSRSWPRSMSMSGSGSRSRSRSRSNYLLK